MRYLSILLFIVILFSYSCAGKQVQPYSAGPPSGYTKPGESAESAERRGVISEEELAAREQRERERLLAESSKLFQDVRFDYDSYAIKEEYIDEIKKIGNWMKEHSGFSVVLEGHADERGTIEYNLVLGQKRAESVRDFLVKIGASESRLKTISYGKEMPLDPAHTEEAW